MIKGKQIRVMKEYPWNDLSVWVEERTQNNIAVAKPLVLQEIKEPYEITNPTLHLSIAAAQQLIDDLWQCGLRPSEGTGSAGQLASVQKHLADMRQLIFTKLNIKKPEDKNA